MAHIIYSIKTGCSFQNVHISGFQNSLQTKFDLYISVGQSQIKKQTKHNQRPCSTFQLHCDLFCDVLPFCDENRWVLQKKLCNMFFEIEMPIVNFLQIWWVVRKTSPKVYVRALLDPWIALLLLKMRAAIDRTSQQFKYVFIIFI